MALAAVAGACSPTHSSRTDEGNTDGSFVDTAPSTTTTIAPDCSPQGPPGPFDLPADPVEASILTTQAIFDCAETVVVTDPEFLELAASVALDNQAPLLVWTADDADKIRLELERLAPTRTFRVGSASEAETETPDEEASATDDDATAAEETAALSSGGVVEFLDGNDPGFDRSQSLLADDRSPADGPIWLYGDDPASREVALAVLPSLTLGGGRLLLGGAGATRPESTPDPLTFNMIGDLSESNRWLLTAPLVAPELPGGGTMLFPDRRIVAFYGSPVTFRLGLLGEQGPEATIDRLKPLVEEYQIDANDLVIPGFELIATVADSKPGDDGDYSNELSLEEMRPWIEVATANDAYVIIDLQPGRTDFLTQARRYEEFLRLPNVGLALDPEWRIGPDQVHLRQIGSVDAAEVNEVADYLASLVREEHLPQKALVLHQFNLSMITNREAINTPPELAVVVHVDGQGPLGSKYGTYDTMLEAPIGPDQVLWWGWKNFIDEDTPTATPGQTNAVEPLPVVITYQ